MAVYYLFGLCLIGCLAIALVSLIGNGNGANEAMRQRLERRRGAPSDGAVSELGSGSTDTSGPSETGGRSDRAAA